MPFLNIFSNKKEAPPQESQLIEIDYREKNSLVPSELIALKQKIEFKTLPIGDYIINNTAIERKTISDLKSSIINKRIFSQIENLKQFQNSLLIIEGLESSPYNSEIISDNAFRGFLLSTALNKKLPIIFTQNEKDTALHLSLLARQKPNSTLSLRPSTIPETKQAQRQYILEGFPSIGPVKAKKLLDKFKTLKEVFNANEDELKEILGVKANEFLELINRE